MRTRGEELVREPLDGQCQEGTQVELAAHLAIELVLERAVREALARLAALRGMRKACTRRTYTWISTRARARQQHRVRRHEACDLGVRPRLQAKRAREGAFR